MTHNLTETGPQAICDLPWCDHVHYLAGTHGSRITSVRTLEPGAPPLAVMLIQTGTHGEPELFVGPELSVTIAQAPRLAGLLSRLGHYELAAAVTSTAALAEDGAA